MIFFVIFSFFHFLEYIDNNKYRNLFCAFFMLSPLFYFRFILVFILFISYCVCLFFNRKNKQWLIYLIIIPSIAFIAIFNNFILKKYFDILPYILLSKHEGFDIVSSVSNLNLYIISFFSALIGPLPNALPVPGKEVHFLLSGGLFLKVFFGPFFFLGIYNGLKEKSYLLPIIVFTLIQVFALFILLEGFELRKAITYTGFYFLISMYGFEKSNNNSFLILYITIASFIMFFWNIFRF